MVKMSADEEIFSLMSEYWEFVGQQVEQASGRFIKAIGDAALIVFGKTQGSEGIASLIALKKASDQWWKARGRSCELQVKVHAGSAVCGMIGPKGDKRLDVYGRTVNEAALLESHGFAISPEAFRILDPDIRKLFKKHTPPIRYIPVEERHRD